MVLHLGMCRFLPPWEQSGGYSEGIEYSLIFYRQDGRQVWRGFPPWQSPAGTRAWTESTDEGFMLLSPVASSEEVQPVS